MTTKATKKSTVVEKSVADSTETKTSKTSDKYTRIVLDLPTASVERFKVLCNLVGDTQSALVTKALDSYVSDRKEVIDQFLALRTKLNK